MACRRQEAGGRRQEAGGSRLKAVGSRQEAGLANKEDCHKEGEVRWQQVGSS